MYPYAQTYAPQYNPPAVEADGGDHRIRAVRAAGESPGVTAAALICKVVLMCALPVAMVIMATTYNMTDCPNLVTWSIVYASCCCGTAVLVVFAFAIATCCVSDDESEGCSCAKFFLTLTYIFVFLGSLASVGVAIWGFVETETMRGKGFVGPTCPADVFWLIWVSCLLGIIFFGLALVCGGACLCCGIGMAAALAAASKDESTERLHPYERPGYFGPEAVP
uniref:Uncharacterized protein n=1 Tax=Chromera velia CCMP2878 TaxID=1169474 RepID=A0A0G4HAT7_9ALVE|mmetsp:Transcript_2891/g.5954  ORF Transcript_2891/g.5954 Transcript_2891/m.5954 type:complete len:222 (+) Transcript_2891:123-788(+)|eukprot:Cvel_25749.t1-p1 / transcript=Cvel_25749.t1 / gene=Cvel_25749 / organism=Chromera_velia_CCMP2878 / gene_product=hypothetical protein / transcript_product=hypothetical protein / location=Cvel_scaffold2964:19173-20971(+) / protein_length=221 / sequence_SO=supercontig / SO=protein_coding / is_pseudo=false